MSDDDSFEAMSGEERLTLAELQRALGPDLPPPGLVSRAEGLLAYADIDVELLDLLEGAAAEPVGSRGPANRTVLSFELADGEVSFELEVAADALRGQLLSGDVVGVELVALDGTTLATPVDGLGRFVIPLSSPLSSLLSSPASGPSRLRLDDGSGRTLATDWFLL